VPEDPSTPHVQPVIDESSSSRSTWLLLGATPLVFLVTYYVSFMTHEYGHSFAAWMLGIKIEPLANYLGQQHHGQLLVSVRSGRACRLRRCDGIRDPA
jgi:hypothetical protein